MTTERMIALYNLRLAVIAAIEHGALKDEVVSIVKDTLFGIEHFGIEDVKANVLPQILAMENEETDS